MPPARDKVWTTRQLLQWTTEHFERKDIDSPRVSAEMLLAHVLETTRLKLYMEADRPSTPLERSAFRELVERATNHEPVDYLVGQCPFFSMMFKVTRDVLIPRPSTETAIEHIIQHVRAMPGASSPMIADVGTGSGIIAVSLAKHLKSAHIIATDISEAALEVAKENAETHRVTDRIDFLQGDLLDPLRGQQFHYLVSNPPYISDPEWQDVAPNVKDYEPESALRAGPDGLDYIRPIIEQAPALLLSPGQLVLEIAASQKDITQQLAHEAGLKYPAVLHDHENLPRILVANAP